MTLAKLTRLNMLAVLMTVMFTPDLLAISYKITPGCVIKSDLSSGHWFLPIEMVSKTEKSETRYTPIYYVSCRDPKCSLVRLPHDTDTLNVMNLTDVPDSNVETQKYTKNSITMKWGLYTIYLTRDGMRVTEDQGDFFAEGYTKCPNQ